MKKIILIVLLVFVANTTVAQVELKDSLALVDLYNSTGGPNWTNNTNWLTSAPVSSWYGVTTDTNRVSMLFLDFNNLIGSIPSSLGNLTHLEQLVIADAQLTDTIPASLGNLTRLNTLGLYANNLTGRIPASLGNLLNLQYLNFEMNQLTGSIPASLGNLINLTNLDLSLNKLNDSIPSSLGNLIKLYSLYLLGNNLTGRIPASFGNYSKLQILNMGSNSLTGSIPASLGNLKNLGNLDLSFNHLSDSIPSTLNNLLNLQSLFFEYNNFTFSGMEEIVQKFSSQFLYYAPQAQIHLHEHNSKLAVSVGGTLSNETFSWYNNNVLDTVITGDSTYTLKTSGSYIVRVSNSIATQLVLSTDTVILSDKMVDSLALVDLYNSTNGKYWSNNSNWLTTEPLNSWYGVTIKNNRIDSLNLSFNNLNGYLPVSIGNLTKVRDLIFTFNSISDTIPSSIGQLVNIENIDFKQNQLTGKLPVSFGNLTNLKSGEFDFNMLSGNIPDTLGNLNKLQYLDLNENQLSGSLPSSLGNLSSLIYLNLAANNISGTIPSSFGNLFKLDTIYLGGNKISGSIPTSFKNLKNLQYINFNLDSLSGKVPSFLGSLSNLTYLGLGGNNFSGEIPDSLGNLVNLNYLVLYSNQLTGNIPSSLGNLSNLTFLDLYNNHLSDSIPASIIDLGKLTLPDISLNNFTFSGMEEFVQRFPYSTYYPQATISLKKGNRILYVSVGGTSANNIYNWYRNDTLIATVSADSTYKPLSDGNYSVQVNNVIATRLILTSDTVSYELDTTVMPDSPRIEYANRQQEGSDGWTNYYFDNNTSSAYSDDTLFLSLKRNGQDVGTIGDGKFTVKLVATAAAGSNSAIKLTNPLITNPSGFWVMNRYWQVTPTNEPISSIGVRFYYNKQDLNDVNGSYPNHNLKNNKLIFYKTIGGNPDPTTNLAGATQIISILPSLYATDSTWTYHQLTDTTQYAEFSVSSFSGGGGGGTGNNQALPLGLISFTASKQTGKVLFQWLISSQANSNYFELQRSVNGISYKTIQTVNATNDHNAISVYNAIDDTLPAGNILYRLKIVSKDGSVNFSKVISVNNFLNYEVSIAPNPIVNQINLNIQNFPYSEVDIQVFDVNGKTVLQKHFNLLIGYNTIKLNSGNLPEGVYIIRIVGGQIVQYLKCIKQ